MAETIRGFNIELGLDTLQVEKGMRDLNRTMGRVNSEFNRSLSAFDRGERSMGRYDTTVRGLTSKLEVQEQIVDRSQRTYDGLSKEYEKNTRALNNASKEVDTAHREMDRLLNSTDATVDEFIRAETAILEAETAFNELNAEVGQNRIELDKAEMSLANAERQYNNIESSLERNINAMKDLHIEQTIAESGWTKAGNAAIGFSEDLGKISGIATRVGDDLTRKITLPALGVATAAGGIVAAFGWGRLVSLDSAQAQLRGLGYEAEDVERISAQLVDALDGGMMTMAEATSAAATAMAAGVEEGQELTRYIQILDAAVVGGTGTFQEMEQVFGRIVDQGYMTRNEFDIIAQRMPGFSSAVQDHMGVSSEAMYEMLRDGEITSDEFLNVMEGFAGDMATEFSQSWEGMVQNLKAYIGIIGENLLSGVFQTSKEEIAGFIDMLSSDEAIAWAEEWGYKIGDAFRSTVDGIRDAVEWYMELEDWQQKLIVSTGIFAVGIGPLLSVVGRLGSGISVLAGGFGKLLQAIGIRSGTAKALSTFGGIVSSTGGKVGLASAGTGLAGKMGLFSGALSALGGPVGIATFALGTTLVGGLVAAYNNSESFKGIVDEMATMVGEGLVNSLEAGKWALEEFSSLSDEVFSGLNEKIHGTEEPIMSFSETMDFALTEAVPAAYGYMWDSTINAMDGFYFENMKGQSSVEEFSGAVSEETQAVIEDYDLMSQEATRLLMELSYSQGEITAEQAENLSIAYGQMNEEALIKLEEKRIGEIEKMQEIFDQTYSLTDQSKIGIEQRINEHYNTEESMLNEKNERIQAIINDANQSENGMTQEHVDAIERIQNDHYNSTTQNLSQTEIEHEAIMRRASNNQQAISEETVSELVSDSVEAREKTIAEAKTKRDDTIAWAVDQYENHGAISEDEMNAIIDDAETQYNSTVRLAERRHDDVLSEARAQAHEHGIIVDGETGDILSKWELFKDNLGTVLSSIATTAWNRAKEIGANIANGIADGVNWMRDQFNKIPEALGISFRLDRMATVPTGSGGALIGRRYSSGTNYHPGGHALLGDKGPGNSIGGAASNTAEIVELPNKKRYLVDGNVIWPDFPKGAKVQSNQEAKEELDMMHAFNPDITGGSGSFNGFVGGLLGDLTGRAVGAALSFSQMLEDVYDYIDNPSALINQLISETSFEGIRAVTELGGGMVNKLSTGMIDKVKDLFDEFGSGGDGTHILGKSILQPFGRYIGGIMFNGGRHYGIDTAHKFDPLISPVNGRVTRVWRDFGGGNSLQVTTNDHIWWFMHLSNIMKSVGDTVKTGMRLGTTGNSGNFVVGSGHLHTQVHPRSAGPGNHNAINPLPILRNLGSFANGGLISQHGYYEGAEGNKPEMIIPLTNRSRAIDLMFEALSYIGGGETTTNSNVVSSALIKEIKELKELIRQLFTENNSLTTQLVASSKAIENKRNVVFVKDMIDGINRYKDDRTMAI